MIRKIELQILFNVTASVFQKNRVNIMRLKRRDGLRVYAAATATWIKHCSDESTRERMFEKMYELGELARKIFGVKTQRGAFRCITDLYRTIGIDVRFKSKGETYIMEVSRCFFSKYYTPQMCDFISAMDRGLVCGVSQKRDLKFVKRITEGEACCIAHFY